MASVFLHNGSTLCLLFLTTTLFIANSARILDEVESQPQAIGNLPAPGVANPSLTTGPVTTTPQIGPATTLPSGQTPTATTTSQAVPATTLPSGQTPADTTITPSASEDSGDEDDNADPPVPETEAPAEDTNITPVATPTPGETPEVSPIPDVTPVTPSAVAKEPSFAFFMHDILGGSHPSARVVAGIVANTDVTGLPFSKLNNNLFPITGGIPLVNPKLNGIITNNNLPNLVGLSGAQSSTVFKNSGTSNTVTGSNNQPFVSAGNLPAGFTIQKLMFGSVTVIDDQITEGHELDSAVIGRAQGFYLASSLDGSSQTIVLTVLMHGGEHEQHHDGVEDSINLFGVHRTASHESEIAVIGGSGKYENARGYAALETLLKEDQHTTDGVDTILHFNVYLTE
ncbi:dirigent protein 24 [Cajanus cajan]|uniref:Dirigent protein n=1 Tax=Cajanus cajan TaxID=3821 RepID=A0A151TCT1_CAJCA|nr:dirigent protein 24 [Cajanus cajan]KYP64847.1 Disease resistance response protein 206 family [Cajanus cajan]